MAQSVDHATLDFNSGHDPRVVGSSPTSGLMLGMEFAQDSLSTPSPLVLTCSLSLSQKMKNKYKKDSKAYALFEVFKKQQTQSISEQQISPHILKP